MRYASGIVIAAIAIAPPLLAQSRPPGVTDSTIAAGRVLYQGAGNCGQCHGEDGVGTPDGVSLIQGQWKLGSGSYEWLLHIIRHTGIATQGRDGDPVPMRGPTSLDSAQVQAVAAYVWSISRNRPPGPSN